MYYYFPIGYDKFILDSLKEESVLRCLLFNQSVEYKFCPDIVKKTGMIGFYYDGKGLSSLVLYVNTDFFLIESEKCVLFEFSDIEVLEKGILNIDSDIYYIPSDQYYLKLKYAIGKYRSLDNFFDKQLVIVRFLNYYDSNMDLYVSEELIKFRRIYIKYYLDAYENYPEEFELKTNIYFDILELDVNSSIHEALLLMQENNMMEYANKINFYFYTSSKDTFKNICVFLSNRTLLDNIMINIDISGIEVEWCNFIIRKYNIKEHVCVRVLE